MLYKYFLVTLVLSLAVPAASVAVLSAIVVKPTLLPLEKEVLGFSFLLPPPVERNDLSANGLENPIGQRVRRGYPPVPLAEMAPARDSAQEEVISLIVLDGRTKLAVIKGTVVKEGDDFQGTTVARIRKDGVLLNNGKEEKWLMVR